MKTHLTRLSCLLSVDEDSSDEENLTLAPSQYLSGLDHLLSDASSRMCNSDEGNICISKKLSSFWSCQILHCEVQVVIVV